MKTASKKKVIALARFVEVLLGVTAVTAVLSVAQAEHYAREDFFSRSVEIPVEAPDTRPEPGQDALDLAIMIFNVSVPDSVATLTYDSDLTDRGKTITNLILRDVHIKIGPAAFSSWAMLGSTLAHEVEIHANQNFLLIYFMDRLGMHGTESAERLAYHYELANVRRFGHTDSELRSINDILAINYPREYLPADEYQGIFTAKPISTWFGH